MGSIGVGGELFSNQSIRSRWQIDKSSVVFLHFPLLAVILIYLRHPSLIVFSVPLCRSAVHVEVLCHSYERWRCTFDYTSVVLQVRLNINLEVLHQSLIEQMSRCWRRFGRSCGRRIIAIIAVHVGGWRRFDRGQLCSHRIVAIVAMFVRSLISGRLQNHAVTMKMQCCTTAKSNNCALAEGVGGQALALGAAKFNGLPRNDWFSELIPW